jgi:hypothetical protein
MRLLITRGRFRSYRLSEIEKGRAIEDTMACHVFDLVRGCSLACPRPVSHHASWNSRESRKRCDGVLLLWGSVSVHAQSTAVSSVAPPMTVYELKPLGTKLEVAEPQPLVNCLPIWGQGARDKGFELPLPFGLDLTYTYIGALE